MPTRRRPRRPPSRPPRRPRNRPTATPRRPRPRPTTGRRHPRPDGPERTCIGCQRVAPATELVRVARKGDGSLGIGRRLSGRGAWLCRSSATCFDAAVRRGAFARALRSPVAAADLASVRDLVIDRVDAHDDERKS